MFVYNVTSVCHLNGRLSLNDRLLLHVRLATIPAIKCPHITECPLAHNNCMSPKCPPVSKTPTCSCGNLILGRFLYFFRPQGASNIHFRPFKWAIIRACSTKFISYLFDSEIIFRPPGAQKWSDLFKILITLIQQYPHVTEMCACH